MRQGFHNGFIKENDKIWAVSLGADYCAEHEWGIKGIKEAFGLPEKDEEEDLIGIDRCAVRKLPGDNLLLMEIKDSPERTYLAYYRGLNWDKQKIKNPKNLPYYLQALPYGTKPPQLVTAWSEDSFGLVCTGEYRQSLREIHAALLAKDAAFFFSSTLGIFENAGLCIGIISKMPEKTLIQLKDSDLDKRALQAAAKAAGIEKIEQDLRASGKSWYALSPSWKDKKKKTVQFWLNPMHQDLYYWGWVSIKDLKDWAKDKGRIMQKEKKPKD